MPVGTPALVLAGLHDPVYGPAYQAGAVQPYLARPTVLMLDSGHGLVLERPEDVAAAMRPFLQGVIGATE